MIEWNIQSRAKACRECGKAFGHEQVYHTLLFDERDRYERVDVCEHCWSDQYGQGATARKGFVSHWQGVFEIPAPTPEPIQKETAETLLRKLVQLNDPQYGSTIFILAVMLERKRTLKVKDQLERDGKRVFVYEQPKTAELFTIPDPGLQLDQLEAVQREVGTLLERGLSRPTEVASPDCAADPSGEATEPAQPVEVASPTRAGFTEPADSK